MELQFQLPRDSVDFKNNFSWSSSRLSTFKSCKRKYLYQYYGFWKGWDEEAPERKQAIYLLKTLQNRHMRKGTITHEAIVFLLKSFLDNEEIDKEAFKEAVVGKMRDQYKTSLAGEYNSDQKTLGYLNTLTISVQSESIPAVTKPFQNFSLSGLFPQFSGLTFFDDFAIRSYS